MLTNNNCLFCREVLPPDVNPISPASFEPIASLVPQWNITTCSRPRYKLGEPSPLFIPNGSLPPPAYTPMVLVFYVDKPDQYNTYLRSHLDCFKQNPDTLPKIIDCIRTSPLGYSVNSPPPYAPSGSPPYARHDPLKDKIADISDLLRRFSPASRHWQKLTLELQLARYLWARENPLTIDEARKELQLHWLDLFRSLKNSQRDLLSLGERYKSDAPALPNLLDMTIEGHNISVVFQTPRPWRPFARAAPQRWQPILPLFAVP